MNKLNTIKFYFLTLLLLTITYSCGSSKKSTGVVENKTSNRNEVELIIPCAGPDFSSDDKAFRGTATGTSINMNQSKKMAYRAAGAFLASDMSSAISIVADDYSKQVQKNSDAIYTGRFEDMTRTIVEEVVNSSSVECERPIKDKETGKITYYVARSANVDNVFAKLSDNISSDEILKIDYDYEKFKETFEKEMEKRKKK